MRWSFSIGRVKGIPIKIHLTFFLIVIWGAFQHGDGNGLPGLVYGALLTLMLFGIVLLHELGHSIAAMAFGIPVKDITLLPIGGLARLERMPDKPVQELIVAAAGPAVNVVLAFLLFPFLIFVIGDNFLSRRLLLMALSGPSLASTLLFLFLVNISLLIFNLIPAFPLDGGRIFRSILAIFIDYQKATHIAVRVGQGFALLLGIYGLFPPFNFIVVIIAFFIFTAGGAEGRSVVVKNVLEKVTARQILPALGTILQSNYTVIEVASLTLNSRQSYFPVMLGDALIGIVSRRGVRQALEKGLNWTSMAEIMNRTFAKFDIDTPLNEIQAELLKSETHVVAIYEENRFRGLIGFDEIEQAFYSLMKRKQASQPV